MWKSQTVADLVLSHSEEVKTIASIASHLNKRRQDRKRCCQSIALTFAVQSSSSSKWMSPPKSPVSQGWCFCYSWRVFTKLVGEISMRECVAGAVKRIAGEIFRCGPNILISPVSMAVPPKHNPYISRMVVFHLDKLEVGVGRPGLERAVELRCHKLLASQLVRPCCQAENGSSSCGGEAFWLVGPTCKSKFFFSIPWNLSHT